MPHRVLRRRVRVRRGCMVACGEADVRKADTEVARRGLDFRTKNIGYIVALRGLRADSGAILATTHLF